MTEKVSSELTYNKVINNHSSTVMRNVSPQNSSSVDLSVVSSVGPTEILIPPSVFNFSKSRLEFDLKVPVQGAGNYTHMNANLTTLLSRIVLYSSATNAVLCDLSNLEKYCSLTTPAGTKLDDFLSKSYYSNAPQSTGANSGPYPVEDIRKTNSAATYMAGVDIGAQSAYIGRQQTYISGANTELYLRASIPFSAFKFCVLSLDKQVYFPENLVLQMYWSPANNYASIATSATVSTTGAGSLATAPSITNLRLSMATEGNLEITSQIINKVMSSGLSLPVCYPTITRQSISSSASHSYQIMLTSGYGSRILGVITAPFDATSGAVYANVHKRGVLTQYNTFLNNVAVKYPAGFNCLNGEDYTIANKPYFEKSTVQTLGEYVLAEWAHIDSFFGEKPLCEVDQTHIDGLDVNSSSAVWSIQASLSAATPYTWISIILGQRELQITNQGVVII